MDTGNILSHLGDYNTQEGMVEELTHHQYKKNHQGNSNTLKHSHANTSPRDRQMEIGIQQDKSIQDYMVCKKPPTIQIIKDKEN